MPAFPWFETVDDVTGAMSLTHEVYLLIGWGWNSQWYQLEPLSWDNLVPQNYDSQYQWAGTPTFTDNAAQGSDLQKLWTLVGVIPGPPPFVLNGASTACLDEDDKFVRVDYGHDDTQQQTIESTSKSVITVAS